MPDEPPPADPLPPRLRGFAVWRWKGGTRIALVAVSPVLYVLSSGPVLTSAFRLREVTHSDLWYMALWIYVPMFWALPRSVWDPYLTWWCHVTGTVGPG